MKGLRFADTQETCFEAWIRSHMGCSAFLCVRFVDSQESRIQVAKRSDMGIAVMKGLRFADFQEWYFQAAKRSNKSSTILQDVDLLMLRNRVLRLLKVHIWVVSPCYVSIC